MERDAPPGRSPARAVARWALAGFLVAAGIGHLIATEEFLAQVPDLLPWRTAIVLVSGVVEISLGVALVILPRHRVLVGWLVAGLLVAVFPGNVHQAVAGTPAFGLGSDAARWIRLAFQPPLVAWALWSTCAWRDRRTLRRSGERCDVDGRPLPGQPP